MFNAFPQQHFNNFAQRYSNYAAQRNGTAPGGLLTPQAAPQMSAPQMPMQPGALASGQGTMTQSPNAGMGQMPGMQPNQSMQPGAYQGTQQNNLQAQAAMQQPQSSTMYQGPSGGMNPGGQSPMQAPGFQNTWGAGGMFQSPGQSLQSMGSFGGPGAGAYQNTQQNNLQAQAAMGGMQSSYMGQTPYGGQMPSTMMGGLQSQMANYGQGYAQQQPNPMQGGFGYGGFGG